MKFLTVIAAAAAVFGISQSQPFAHAGELDQRQVEPSAGALAGAGPAADVPDAARHGASPAELDSATDPGATPAMAEPSEPTPSGPTPSAGTPVPVDPSAPGDAKVFLMPTGAWFAYPHGCDTVRKKIDLVLHFHGAPPTVIPRYLAAGVDAVLVIINKGIGSGPYSDAFAAPGEFATLLERIEHSIAEECHQPERPVARIALSSWSAGYGATQMILRRNAARIDAVLLADGLHVGFSNARRREVRLDQLEDFSEFAKRASRGHGLMAITHSAIEPEKYASAAETALALSEIAHAPTWPVSRERFGMLQLTSSRRGQFYVAGFAGNSKRDHANQLYAIGQTNFTRLRDYWSK